MLGQADDPLLVGANLGWYIHRGHRPICGTGAGRIVPTKVGTHQRRYAVGPDGPPEPITARATLRRIYPLPHGAKKG